MDTTGNVGRYCSGCHGNGISKIGGSGWKSCIDFFVDSNRRMADSFLANVSGRSLDQAAGAPPNRHGDNGVDTSKTVGRYRPTLRRSDSCNRSRPTSFFGGDGGSFITMTAGIYNGGDGSM